jgi:hypothetical protein
MSIAQAALFTLLPWGVLRLAPHFKLIRVCGPVIICYAVGILWGNLLPYDKQISMTLSEVSVPLAIPLFIIFNGSIRLAKNGQKHSPFIHHYVPLCHASKHWS